MLKHTLSAAAFSLCFAASAFAQDAAPPAVDTMTCEQMTAEMTTAGQTMNSQLDPEFAREAQAMHEESQSRERPRGNQGAQAEQNRARMEAQGQRLENSMAGLDQDRLMALANRFEQMRCETPQ